MCRHASLPAGMPLHSPYTHTFLSFHTVPLHSCSSPCTHTLSLPTMSHCSFCSRLSHHYVCPALLLPERWHQCPERQLHGMPCFNPWHHEIIWRSWFLPGERDALQFVSSWGAAEQADVCIKRGIYVSPTPLLQGPSQLCLHLGHHSAQALSSHLFLSGLWAPVSQS